MFFFSSRRRHTRLQGDWSSDVCSSDLSLEDCARDAVALARGEKHQPVAFTIPDAEVAHMVSEARRGRRPEQRFVRGVYSGGTLAWKARSVLDTTLGDVAPGVTGTGGGHRVVDLGEDVFTVGRPHPMIDGTVRREWIAREAADPSTAALLLDIVLGHGAHPDPAGELLPAIDAARDQASRRGGALAVVASVTGTDADPQNRSAQVSRLRTPLTATCTMSPSRDPWVISQKASPALKYMSGVGAEPSPPRFGPSSHANVLCAVPLWLTVASFKNGVTDVTSASNTISRRWMVGSRPSGSVAMAPPRKVVAVMKTRRERSWR